MMYNMGNGINAKNAQEMGIVNEVLPAEKILPRAWELAEEIMKKSRPTRRMTHQLIVRPLKRLFTEDYMFHITSEMYGFALNKTKHDFEQLKKKVDAAA